MHEYINGEKLVRQFTNQVYVSIKGDRKKEIREK